MADKIIPKGERKIRIALWLAIPFLLLCCVLIFYNSAQTVEILKILHETIVYIFGFFVGGNAVEHFSNNKQQAP
jgi:hypothetical protein